MLSLFGQGILLGFSIAMPVGPIGILCIRNSLTYGMAGGLISGLGAACADVFYGGLAIVALETVSHLLDCHMQWIRLFGAAALLFIGILIFRAPPARASLDPAKESMTKLFITTCLLTLSNPMTLLAFVGIYAALGIDCQGWFPDAILLMGGLFAGSALWWLCLSYIASFFKEKINAQALLWINRISGAVIFAFGIFVFFSL